MRLYRIGDGRHPLWDGTGAALIGGRWNSPGRPLIYASLIYGGAMLEIYFLFFYIPRKVRKLAKEKGQSALAWSLMAIGAWIGTEVILVIAAVVLGMLIP